MHYLRIYTDADGVSHFEDVELPMTPVTTVTGVTTSKGRSLPIRDAMTFTRVEPHSDDAGLTAVGAWGPWQNAVEPHYKLWLEGELEMQVGDGEIRRIGPGTLLLEEDATGQGHRNRRLTSTMRNMLIPVEQTPPRSESRSE